MTNIPQYVFVLTTYRVLDGKKFAVDEAITAITEAITAITRVVSVGGVKTNELHMFDLKEGVALSSAEK